MKAMSFWAPWGSLVANRIKVLETRPRRSPWHAAIGQTVAVHQALRPARDGECARGQVRIDALGNPYFWLHDAFTEEQQIARGLPPDGDLLGFPMPLGAIVGTVGIVDVVPMVDDRFARNVLDAGHPRETKMALRRDDEPFIHEQIIDVSDQRPYGDFAPGRWAIVLADAQAVHPAVPCRGRQGLWSVPDDVVRAVDAQTLPV